MQNPITLTIPEAVRLTGISRSALYEALRRGHLTAKKAGRRTLITVVDLEAYVDNLPAYEPKP